MKKRYLIKGTLLLALAIPLSYLLLPRIVKKYKSITADHTVQVTDELGIAMLQYLPDGYESNSEKYPLVIFLHGIFEKGWNTRNRMLLLTTVHRVDKVGLPRLIKEGHDFPFIVVSPQLKIGMDVWPSWYILEVVKWAKRNLRVDEKRIHITGLSLGGAGVFCSVDDLPHIFASGAPICASWNNQDDACNLAKENVAIWAFHGQQDPQVHPTATSAIVGALNACSISPPAKATIFPDLGHNVWDSVYEPDAGSDTPDIYKWMMSVRKERYNQNFLPDVDAGKDIKTSSKTIELNGTGHDKEDSLVNYSWTMMSGPNVVTFESNRQSHTKATLPENGIYYLRLTVTDNEGGSDSDYVKIVLE